MIWILNLHVLIHESYCVGGLQEGSACVSFCRKALYSCISCYTYEGLCRNPPCFQPKSQLVKQGSELKVPLKSSHSVQVEEFLHFYVNQILKDYNSHYSFPLSPCGWAKGSSALQVPIGVSFRVPSHSLLFKSLQKVQQSLVGCLTQLWILQNNGFFLSSSVRGLDIRYYLTIPSPVHLFKTWFSSSAIHGITRGSSATFPFSFFLFSPTKVVVA